MYLMRISQVLHLWLLECNLVLQVCTSLRIRSTSIRFRNFADKLNVTISSNVSPSVLVHLRYAQDQSQLPDSISVPSHRQSNILCIIGALLLLILAAVASIAYRLHISAARKRAADQLADERAQSLLDSEIPKNEAAKNEAEPADILPNDTVQWMWGDANVMGRLSPGKGHSLAQRDPLRWSRWSQLSATIVDLEKCKDAQHASRPVEMRTRRTKAILHFPTVDEALAALREQAEAADFLRDDTVQWMWGDASAMGRLSSGKGHSLAQRDPLRWSRWNGLGATIVDLSKCKDAQNASRPVKMRTRRARAILYFNTVDEALAALREPTEAADNLSYDSPVDLGPRSTSKNARSLSA